MNPIRTALIHFFLLTFACAAAVHAADDPEVQWITDASGCKAANPFPRPGETVTWSGACKDGLMDGDGVLQWFLDGKTDDRYEGHITAGWAEGNGTLTRVDGGRYTGTWKKSVQDGKGRYEGPQGEVYDGEWKDGQPHGLGMLRTPDGQVIRGRWVNGEFDGLADDGNPNRI